MNNNKEKSEEILKALNWRYAAQIFDPNKRVSEEDLHTILESARLSPGSLGLEAWKFLVVINPEIRAKIGKQRKMTEASHLIVITYRTDMENILKERLERTAKIQNQKIEDLEDYRKFLDASVSPRIESGVWEQWIKAQAYIPLGIMIQTASLLGIDNGPMEGFNPAEVDELLGLKAKNLKSVTMLALGYRGEDPAALRPKVRREFNEVVEFID